MNIINTQSNVFTGGLSAIGPFISNSSTTSFGTGSATGLYSFAAGYNTKASGNYSTALGINNTASGYASTVQGAGNVASGNYSHAQGENNVASGESSYAGGAGTLASGLRSTAIGQFSSATKTNAYASGKYAFANHNRSWVWQGTNLDAVSAQFVSTRTDQFAIRPAGGVYLSGAMGIGTDSIANALTVVGNISASGVVYTAGGSSDSWNSSTASISTLNLDVYSNEIHVSQVDGDDITGTGYILNPVATIGKATTLVTANKRKIIVHSGGYNESPTLSGVYTTLTSEQQKGDDVIIYGTVNTAVGCTIAGLKMTNLNINTPALSGNVNVLGCDITGTLTKSAATAYTLIRFCDIGTVNITGAGLVAMLGGNPNRITINNAAAQVIVKTATTVAPVLSAGNANVVDSIVIAGGATSNAISTAAGTIVTLANSQIIVPAYNNVARVSLNGFYSIFNCTYDKPNSTLVTSSGTGGSTNSIDYFQHINADKVITPNGNSDNWNAAYTQATTYPQITAMRFPNINLSNAGYINTFTVPTGRGFVATGLTVIFDSGVYNNAIAGSIRLTRGSVTNTANRITADLNIGIATYNDFTLLRRSSINDNVVAAQAGEIVQIVMSTSTTAYVADVLIEGVLY
jgi:hypothetical protein